MSPRNVEDNGQTEILMERTPINVNLTIFLMEYESFFNVKLFFCLTKRAYLF